MLDVIVAENLVTLGINRDHLARTEPPALNDLRLIDRNQSDFGPHHDQSATCDLVPGWPKSVAIHRRRSDRAVCEGHRRRAVPRFSQTSVVLVEATKIRIHVLEILPSLRDQHHHRVEWAAA